MTKHVRTAVFSIILLAPFASASLAAEVQNGANLNGANLNGANLNGANLNGANLNGASMEGHGLAVSGDKSAAGAVSTAVLPDGTVVTLR